MTRYLLAWGPAVVAVGTVVTFSCAYLALIALALVAFVAVPALAVAIVVSPYLLVPSLNRGSLLSGVSQPRAQHAGRSEERGTP
jgi:hypothetical protein